MQMPYVSESLKSLHPQIIVIIIIKSKKKQADKQPKICGRTSIYHQFKTYCLCKFLSGDLGTKIRRLHVHECAHWVQRINSNFLILLHCLMLFFLKKVRLIIVQSCYVSLNILTSFPLLLSISFLMA